MNEGCGKSDSDSASLPEGRPSGPSTGSRKGKQFTPPSSGEPVSEEQYNALFADFRRVQYQLQREQQHFQSALQVSRHELTRANQANSSLRQANQSLAENLQATEMQAMNLQQALEEQQQVVYDLSQRLRAAEARAAPATEPGASSPSATEKSPHSPSHAEDSLDSKQGSSRSLKRKGKGNADPGDKSRPAAELVPFCCQVSTETVSRGVQTDVRKVTSPERRPLTIQSLQVHDFIVNSSLAPLPTTKPIVVRVFSQRGPAGDVESLMAQFATQQSLPPGIPSMPQTSGERWADEPFEPDGLQRDESRKRDSNADGGLRPAGRTASRDDVTMGSLREVRNPAAATFPAPPDGRDRRGGRGGKGGPRHNRWGSGGGDKDPT